MMKAYPEYKDSTVDWLEFIPSHWIEGNLNRFGYFVAGSGFPNDEQGIDSGDLPFFKVGDTNKKGNEVYLTEADNYISFETAKKLGVRVAPSQGIMFPKVGAALLGNKRRILHSESIVDNNCMVYVPTDGLSKFWMYVLSIMDFGLLSNPGPVPSVNESQLKRFQCVAPAEDERRKIAIFLDVETNRIDNLIAEKENFIKLLSKKRQALISHVVTKGLNPNVPMKDSGVEWIGEIPEHWTECTLRRHVVEHRQGYYTTEDYVDEGVKLLRITDLEKYGEIDAYRAPRVALKDELNNYYLEKGDFVFARTGGAGTFGLVGELEEPMVYASYLIRFRFNKNICPQFLKFAFQSKPLFTEITKNMHGGVNQNIHAENIKDAVMPFPEYDEQERIANYLEVETDRMLVLEEEVLKSIELLKEHRTALISAAVTGKIDVREEV